MITIRLGKIFCELYNEENGTNLTPRDIFRNVIVPLLYKDKEHLTIWVRSKFWSWRFKEKNTTWNPDVLEAFCEEVESEKGGLEDSLKVFGGCAAPYDTQNKEYKNVAKTTLFCYAENQHFTIDERYCSWIGSIFLLNTNGLYSIAINDKEYVKIMYESVKAYKKTLMENPDIEGKQLNTWNTIYFYNYFHNNDVDTLVEKYYDGTGFKSPFGFEHILFIIAKYFPKIKFIDIEKYGNKNLTCGTILVDTGYVNRTSDILEKLYKSVSDNEDFSKFSFNKEFGGENLLHKAMERGCVYDGFFDPLTDVDNVEFGKKNKKNKTLIKYIELIMTDKDKQLAQDFANEMHRTIKDGGKNKKNIHFEVVFSPNRLIDNITEVIKISEKKDNPAFNDMIDYIVTKGQSNDFKLMVSYIKFLLANK